MKLSSDVEALFERRRSIRSFVSALFFGVVSGAIISIVFADVVSVLLPELQVWVRIAVFGVLGSAIFLIAVFVAQRIEYIPLVYACIVRHESIDAMCRTALDLLPNGGANNKVAVDLNNLKTDLGTMEGLSTTSLPSLKEYYNSLQGDTREEKDLKLRQILEKLCQYISTIIDAKKTVTQALGEALQIFVERGYQIDAVRLRVLKGRFWKRAIIEFQVESNLQNNLRNAAYVYVAIFQTDPQELRFLTLDVRHVLHRVASSSRLSDLGVSFERPGEEEYWERLRSELSRIEPSRGLTIS